MTGSIGTTGPLWAAVSLAAIAAGGAYAGISAIPFTHGVHSAELSIAAAGSVDVMVGQAAVDRVFARVGQRVVAGEVVAQIDSSEIDREIGSLKEQAGDVQRQLEAVRVEAQSFGILHGQKLVSRTKVIELEGQLAGLERQARDLMELIRSAEERLARAVVRAPVTGTVSAASPHAPGQTFRSGEVILQISADPDRLVLEGEMPADLVAALREAGEARAWLGAASLLQARPLRARLTWLAPLEASASAGTPQQLAPRAAGRLEIDRPLSDLPAGIAAAGTRVMVHVHDPRRRLRDHLLGPLRRSFGSLFPNRVHGA